jgi:hypothetical protein
VQQRRACCCGSSHTWLLLLLLCLLLLMCLLCLLLLAPMRHASWWHLAQSLQGCTGVMLPKMPVIVPGLVAGLRLRGCMLTVAYNWTIQYTV